MNKPSSPKLPISMSRLPNRKSISGGIQKAYSSVDQNFSYITGSKPALAMKECRESLRLAMRVLTECTARRDELLHLDEDNPDKLRAQYRTEILVKLLVFNNKGIVDLAELKSDILFKTMHGDSTTFREAVEEVCVKLGIEVK